MRSLLLKDNSMQKSPKGAAGQAQQVRDTKSFTKRQLRAKVSYGCSRISTTSARYEVFYKKDNYMQKSPKGAAGQAQ
jgi:hypothetical protein